MNPRSRLAAAPGFSNCLAKSLDFARSQRPSDDLYRSALALRMWRTAGSHAMEDDLMSGELSDDVWMVKS